ncbi:MAG TPA: vitamin K epoxide reductase family protein [Gemmatimonadota bacterium]|nr:vitamin K epoxide reductase family protein [Gemmatimonadota bacterium]
MKPGSGPLWTARAIALAGFLDAMYLTASHYAGSALACGPGGGCDIVTASRYATVGDVPIAAIGLGYYVLVNLLVWTPAASLGRGATALLLGITGAATAVSGVLVYLQAAVIHAWCQFCLLSAAITLGLFLCAVLLFRDVRLRATLAEAEPGRIG